MNERDELAKAVFVADNYNATDDVILSDWEALVESDGDASYAHRIAQGLIQAGYRRPRTITSLAELAALPPESAVQTSDTSDTVVLKGGDGLFVNAFGGEVGADDLWRYGTKPFTVIYEPQQ